MNTNNEYKKFPGLECFVKEHSYNNVDGYQVYFKVYNFLGIEAERYYFFSKEEYDESFYKYNVYDLYHYLREAMYKNYEHNEDGPADIEYYENDKIKMQIYYINGEYHRLDGKCIIAYNEDGSIDTNSGYIEYRIAGIEDEKLDKIETDEEFFKYIKFLNIK